MKISPFTVGLLAFAFHAQAQEPVQGRVPAPTDVRSDGHAEDGTLRALARVTKRIQTLFDPTLRLIDRYPTMPTAEREILTGVIDELAGMLRENAAALRRGDLATAPLQSQEARLEFLEERVTEVSARLETETSKPAKGGQR